MQATKKRMLPAKVNISLFRQPEAMKKRAQTKKSPQPAR